MPCGTQFLGAPSTRRCPGATLSLEAYASSSALPQRTLLEGVDHHELPREHHEAPLVPGAVAQSRLATGAGLPRSDVAGRIRSTCLARAGCPWDRSGSVTRCSGGCTGKPGAKMLR